MKIETEECKLTETQNFRLTVNIASEWGPVRAEFSDKEHNNARLEAN